MHDFTIDHYVESRFRALVEQSPIITYTHGLDESQPLTYISPQVESILGYSPGEVLAGQPHFLTSRIHPEDTTRVQTEVEAGQHTLRPFRTEYRVQARDGRWIWLQDQAMLVRDAQGHPLLWQGVLVDVTAVKETEEALHDSEARFRAAFDHAPIGLAVVLPNGRFAQVNQALCTLVGYSEAELLGKSFQDITHAEDLSDEQELATRLWAGEIDTYRLEKRFEHKDGHLIWIQLTASVVRDDGRPRYAIAQIQDVTARRRLDLERATMLASERDYSRQLRALTEMRADLSAMIAHELRSPVAAIRLMIAMLATGELNREGQNETFMRINAEIEQIDRLISDVASTAAADTEDFSVQLHAVPLDILLEGATAFARAALPDHPILTTASPEVHVWCDPERISQVLRNLLDNVGKHTAPGTPVVLSAHMRQNRVEIEVADQGPGIAADDQSVIFEKFGRGREATMGQIAGAGLGLYLSRQIIEAHGAELTVDSEPDSGTAFKFQLRVA
jgi:PAS domain S-box-containing protein